MSFTGFLHQTGETPPGTAWHGLNGLVCGPSMEEEGVDEMCCSELRFPHQTADGFGATIAAGTDGEVHDS